MDWEFVAVIGLITHQVVALLKLPDLVVITMQNAVHMTMTADLFVVAIAVLKQVLQLLVHLSLVTIPSLQNVRD